MMMMMMMSLSNNKVYKTIVSLVYLWDLRHQPASNVWLKCFWIITNSKDLTSNGSKFCKTGGKLAQHYPDTVVQIGKIDCNITTCPNLVICFFPQIQLGIVGDFQKAEWLFFSKLFFFVHLFVESKLEKAASWNQHTHQVLGSNISVASLSSCVAHALNKYVFSMYISHAHATKTHTHTHPLLRTHTQRQNIYSMSSNDIRYTIDCIRSPEFWRLDKPSLSIFFPFPRNPTLSEKQKHWKKVCWISPCQATTWPPMTPWWL